MRYRVSLKVCLLLVIAILLAIQLQSSVVRSMPYTVTQPDGSKLDCFVSGDEYHNWLHDKDNYTIIPDPNTGYYCYARQNGDNVASSGIVAGSALPQSRGLTPGINISTEAYKQLRNTKFWAPPERDAPTLGTVNNLVIFIRFSDETEFGDLTSLNGGRFNTDTNSLKNYFLEASYNQLTVNTTFYPTTTTNYVVSWQSSNPRAYYQPYDASTNPIGYNGDSEERLREFSLLQSATNGVSSQIPSNLTIDSDGDGRVDNVVFIVRGAAGAWSSLLWPHRWSLYDRYVYINGKRVYDYNFQLQTFLTSRGVGVLCHEFFHSLGAPDLYHYTDNGIDPAGKWDIMEDDENPPQHMTAFMKYKYGDWISSIPTITADGVYTLNPLTSSTGNAYRINSNNASQYYIVEFRKDTGTFESSIPGSGMLIYRIDTTCGNGNADGPPDEVYIYRLNGTTTVNGTLSSANYSSETGRIKIDNTTNPAPFLQDGSAGNLYLCEVGSSAGTTMSFRKGAPFINFTPNPYSQGFDATYFPPDGWAGQAVSGTDAFIRVTSGTNPTCSPQSGAGMIKYNSDTSVAGSSAYFASPRIAISEIGSSAYAVSFYMYRDGNQSTALDRIEVYSNTTQNLSGTPTLLGTVNRARTQAPAVSTPGWYQYNFTLPFTVTGDYYAVLKAVSASGYNMFVDNIKIAKVPFAAINPGPTDTSTGIHFAQSLSWQSGGGAPTGYKLYLGTNNPPTNLVNGISQGLATSYNHSANWTFGTTYYWKIVPYADAGDAAGCPVWSFTVMPNTSVFPLVDDFGTADTIFPPTDWTRYSGFLSDPTTLVTTTSYWGQDDWTNTISTPANKSARMNIYANRAGWLISPLLNIPAGAKLEFDLALTDYANSNPISSDPVGQTGTDDQFAVLIGNGYTWTSANLLRLWDNAGSPYVYNSISPTGQRVILNLSAYQGYKYIAFYGASTLSNADNDLFVDNVAISVAPSTPQFVIDNAAWQPGTILMNSSLSKQFTITNGGLSNLQITSIGISGDAPFSLQNLPALPATLSLGQSCSFTALFAPAIAGDFAATISIGDNRMLTTVPLSGTSFDARIANLPSTQNFDAVISPNLPLGWNAVIASTSSSAYVRTTTTYPVSPPHSVYLTNSADAAADLRLVSPELLVPMNTLRLKFSARGGSSGYTLFVGTMASPSGTFNQLGAFQLTNAHAEYVLSLADYTGTDRYLAFKHGLGGTSRSIYLDNILFEELLTSDLMVSGLQPSTIGVMGSELSYQVSVTNNGLATQTAYTVKLMSVDSRIELASLDVFQPLEPNATALHNLLWTPENTTLTAVYVQVLLPEDGYTGNNISGVEPVYIYPAQTYLPDVGDMQSTTTSNVIPLDFFYKNSVCETIYLASELNMTAGSISALAYYNNFVESLADQRVKIWMKNTTDSDVSLAWLPFDGYTLVFDGTVYFPAGTNTVLIQLENAFTYTGGNLAVRVNRPLDSVYYNTSNHFYYAESIAYPNRSRYLYSDSITYDPTNPAATGTLSSNIPLTTFVVMNYVPLALAPPMVNLLVSGNTVSLNWNAVQGANIYKVFATSDPAAWPDTPLAEQNQTSYNYDGPAQSMFFKIVAEYRAVRTMGRNYRQEK